MTVSRVLRRDPMVSNETRLKIERAIEELGYEPLQSARNLSSSVPRVLGIIVAKVSEPNYLRLGYEYLSALHLGALQTCMDLDYGLMLFQADSEGGVDSLVRKAKGRQVGGFIVGAPATETSGLLDALVKHDIPFSAINSNQSESFAMQVMSDDRLAVQSLVGNMVAKGHRRIAFVGGGLGLRACTERAAGYLDAMSKLNTLGQEPRIIVTRGIAFDDGLEVGRKLLGKRGAPTSFQCVTDDLAAGLITAALEKGLKLPDDVSIAGFDNFAIAKRVFPSLTTANLPAEEMAAVAARQVIERLEGKMANSQICLPCPVIERQSIAVHVNNRLHRA